MIDDQDFALEAEAEAEVEARPEADAGVEDKAPAPKVIIEYRSRGLSATLGAPTLILVAALAIASYQRQRPIRPRPLPPASADAGTPNPAAEPLIVKVISSPAPPGPVEKAEDAEHPGSIPARAAAEASPFDLDPPHEPPVPGPEPAPVEVAAVARPAIGFIPPGDRKPVDAHPVPPRAEPEPEAPAPAPAPAPTRDEVMEDIIHEAERKETERQRLENLKPKLGVMALADQIRKSQGQRAAFHDDLRQILMNPTDDPGKDIRDLCDQYGRETRVEIERAVDRALSTSHSRLSRRAKVKMMRDLGLPEPRILDFLAHEMDLRVNSRGGPRDRNEVRVQAARLLLMMPVATTPETAPSRPAVPSAASPFAHAVPASVRGPNRPPQ
jgi:hypothetical protein